MYCDIMDLHGSLCSFDADFIAQTFGSLSWNVCRVLKIGNFIDFDETTTIWEFEKL